MRRHRCCVMRRHRCYAKSCHRCYAMPKNGLRWNAPLQHCMSHDSQSGMSLSVLHIRRRRDSFLRHYC
jgi:hypothetical protein